MRTSRPVARPWLALRPGLRSPADWRALAFLLAQTVLMVALWTGFARHWAIWFAAAWLAVSAATIKHNHLHRRTFRAAWANLLLDHWLGLLTGTTATSIITEHNQRHHGHNNTDDDFVRASHVGYRSQLLNLLCYFPRVWWDLYVRKPLDLKLWWRTQPALFRRSLAEQLTLWGTFTALLIVNWQATLLYVALVWLHGQWWLITFNLLQHQELAPDDPWQNSRNLVDRASNFFFFNVGFHTAHHLRPTLHWSELPRFHREHIAPRIDPRLVSPTLWSFYRDWYLRRGVPAASSA